MNTRLIQIILPEPLADQVLEQLDDIEDANWWRSDLEPKSDPPRCQIFVLAKPGMAQGIMDKISEALEGEENWRQILLPVEATEPEILSEEEEAELRTRSISAAREEILSSVRENAALTPDYLIMVALSSIVAGIALNLDQMTALIGAMVIAPLLGPIMGLALGVALGTRRLLISAAIAGGAGIGTCFVVTAALAFILEPNTDSALLNYGEPLSPAALALALASGAAAALATSTGKATALVGVMVAAAILPPLVAVGLLLASGAPQEAARAGFLAAANFICIGLSAQAVFILKGVRPRLWSDLKDAETSRWLNLVILSALTVALGAVLWFWDVI